MLGSCQYSKGINSIYYLCNSVAESKDVDQIVLNNWDLPQPAHLHRLIKVIVAESVMGDFRINPDFRIENLF